MSKKPKSLKDLKKSNQQPQEPAQGDKRAKQNIHAAIGDAKGNQVKALAIGGIAVVMLLSILAVFYVFSKGLAVQIKPDDAVPSGYVTLESGLGWVSDDGEVFAFGSNYQIGVHADDFISQTIDISSEQSSSFIEVTLEPKPAIIELTTEPAQDGTKWAIDGKQVSTLSMLSTELAPGNYQLLVDHPYFEPTTQALSLKRAENFERVIPLSKVQGQVSIQASPSGAAAILDGVTPVVLPYAGLLEGGQHTIQVTAAGYVPITDQIEIINTQRRVERNYRLQPLQSGIRVTVQPQSARITLDGRSVNNAAVTTVNANQNYRIEVSRSGYVSEQRSVRVSPGATEEVAISLRPAFGAVTFNAEPRGTDVYINGQNKGQSPLTLDLQVLPTKVEFKRTGYRSITENITPVLNKPIDVNVRLRTELDARLRELPRVMTDSTGIELVRFTPDQQAFFIGAQRGDPGQLANEIYRQMQLTKHFYAGKYEVTVGQFKKFSPSYSGAGSNNMPATNVSWIEAAQFCNWLSEQERLTPFYTIRSGQVVGYDPYADGYRLPTETEWEWLARKARRQQKTSFTWGTRTTITKASGNLADESAKGSAPKYIPNYTDGYAALAPVGSFPAEASGLHDMSGNVREWVNDRYALNVPPKGSVAVNHFGPPAGDGHVVKGSSYKSANLTNLRAASRQKEGVSADDIGFRVVRYVYGAEDK
ncbi:SUMF1/EgtB/PvdO family nonheme iron enzyme [Kordiimonas sp. SCSIO 12610]|uniref:SUMF1/EgtB/PvdO family nonheme iron enzyme n=1 Tax=Kordiimonas sp. SCSIO 12610 TaxID=2829597 RepID=UPI00210BCC73|nr:SUMF1/EgtB/PvdO family nonheme iron enzyme [Kordiimonas sp. SCSIO 12610]UTW55662.1 SUMF1/EgtB/PvdO family nonheme iron enzyme [Kordiimonas sp. SCSIO 12610]